MYFQLVDNQVLSTQGQPDVFNLHRLAVSPCDGPQRLSAEHAEHAPSWLLLRDAVSAGGWAPWWRKSHARVDGLQNCPAV